MLESKYKRLEYLQSSGTQWIDTGILANDETGMQVDVQYLNNSDTVCIGSRAEITNSRCFIGNASSGYYYGWNIIDYTNRPVHDLNRNILSLNYYNSRKRIFNGTTLTDTLETLYTQTGNIYLFVANNNGSAGYKSSVKMYSAQITQGSTLVRNFIPVLRKSDNEIGMLDLIEGKFYGNAGTGKFTANLDVMYALIQGTPTVQDGRVWGFSTTNYLKLDRILNIDNKTWEYQIKFRLNQKNIAQALGQRLIISTIIGDNNKIRYYTTNSSVFNGDYGSHILSLNQDYYFKIVYNGSSYTSYISKDGKTWEVDITSGTTSIVIPSPSDNGVIGSNLNTNTYIHGTIDLNRSYIKIDDTKYKLQAVVGYTKVGSPTITDGVASGFSASDYLETSADFNNQTAYTNGIIVQVAITMPNTEISETGCPLGFGFSSANLDGFTINVSNILAWRIFGDTNILRNYNKPLVLGQSYVIRGIIENGVATLYCGSDEEHLELYATKTLQLGTYRTPAPATIGCGHKHTTIFTGSIDLNSTYIKINNKLWFNGLPNN
jgi:hypothetical protein